VSKSVAQLKQRVVEAEAKVQYLESLLDSFWTGDVPDGATFNHMILAKWGRKRLEEKAKQPALLVSK
jgi:hypothetical protein